MAGFPRKVGCFSSGNQEMKIFRTDTKEIIGRIEYMKRGRGLRFLSGCIAQSKIGFVVNPDVGTNAKVLLMGVLFLLVSLKKIFITDAACPLYLTLA